jgi:hypothetical protein
MWVMVLLLVVGRYTMAQVRPKVPPGHEEFLSGGATMPDLEKRAPGPKSAIRVVRTGPKTGSNQLVVGANVQVNDPQQPFPNGLLGRSETTVATNEDGQQVLVGFNDAQGFCGPPFGVACTPENPPGLSGFGFSLDGGLTFTDGGAPDPKLFNNVFTRGDPWMDRGGLDNKTFFYANLSVDATTAADLGASVHRGHFNGSGFAFEDVRVLGPANPNDFFDKEAIAAAKDKSGLVVVSLTNFRQICTAPASGLGEITIFHSSDGGATYQGPVVVGPDLTNPGCTTGVLQQSSAPATGPNGEVFVAWQRGPTFTATGPSTNADIVVARSLDGGFTFGSPVTVASVNSMRQNPPVGYNRNRLNDHPRIFVATSGQFQGRVFVTFYSAVSPVGAAPVVSCPPGTPAGTTCIGQNLVSSQVFVSFSDDQGQTWSTPVAVAPVVPPTGVKRWWPVVTVADDGEVNVVYYESQETTTASNPQCNVGVGGNVRRVGSANSLVDTFVVQSGNGGNSFGAPVKVTTATSNWCTTVSNIRPNFGDYIGSSVVEDTIQATWADGRNGVPDTFFAPITF